MDHRLKKNSQFKYVYKKGERVYTENFTLFVVKSKFNDYKVGYSISKKLGKANKRNKLKRRMREVVRNSNPPKNCNFVIMPKEKAAEISFAQVQKEIQKLFEKYEKKKNS